jgi:hypothetical protein
MIPADLRIPHDAEVLLAADTGTYLSALLVAIDSEHHAFVLDEFPNYRYVSDQIELQDQTVPEWAHIVVRAARHFHIKAHAWADPNTQFRTELHRYGLRLLKNKIAPEARTAVAREYFRRDRIHLAPWLSILPYELEHAQWPDTTTASGRFSRRKKTDHTLDCLEHILSRRPRGVPELATPRTKTFLETYLAAYQEPRTLMSHVDPHLGGHY